MRYKKYQINPIYFCGSDFTILKNGNIRTRKPTSKDIEYYEVLDPEEERVINVLDVKEGKELIDKFIDIDLSCK